MSKLILIAENQTLQDAAQKHIDTLLSAWHGPDKPQTHFVLAKDLQSSAQTLTTGIAWIWYDNSSSSSLYETLSHVQDAHAPSMITFTSELDPHGSSFDDGIVYCHPDATPDQTAVMIRTLFCQYHMIDGMRREMRVLNAHQGGLADQIGKMDEELRLAAQLQREFLPRELPTLRDVSFQVLWRPAGYVSGDIYDVQRLDENHIGFFVADAVGHGVPAALMTMYIKRSLQTKVIDPDSPRGYRILTPSETLAKLNHDMIERQAGKVRFATACCGLINCETNTLQIARAGHPFPMVLKADGANIMIEPEGGLLGVFPDEIFEQAEVTLNPNDRLLLYSDGFEVAFPQIGTQSSQGRIANEQYLEEFNMLREGHLEEVFDRFCSRLDQQAGSLNQRDDLTVICLAVNEKNAQQNAA
ncbi:Phosphoserine phosphatase RsbP [Poriferisphaera corsica]|uniref:Phosphoserine phosphatase RsbP n=1 Tax=Poriferisphaera corsica TaxID=2528020 RepID=A0A517YTP2_9BACT|nr:PP2C family protein-serine/threonine phosphatase [Poriferisphaera corsica]QDU33603.1 Phosphoserine phosphatase RsbP [Poriferisphaera corsica]